MLWLELTIAGASLLLVGVTALSFIPSNAAWIRVWDFPHQQIATLLVLMLHVTLCHKPVAGTRQDVPDSEPEDRQAARQAIRRAENAQRQE
jgi:hypothetical protein